MFQMVFNMLFHLILKTTLRYILLIEYLVSEVKG